MDLTALPTVNAILNGTAGLLLTVGFIAVRAGRVSLHRGCMLAAFTASVLFLASYLTYHVQVPVTPFRGEGTARTVYYLILVPHIILAIVMVPMALITLRRALRGDFARHRRLARVTLPIWLYVSITGVLVYLMLYVWFADG